MSSQYFHQQVTALVELLIPHKFVTDIKFKENGSPIHAKSIDMLSTECNLRIHVTIDDHELHYTNSPSRNNLIEFSIEPISIAEELNRDIRIRSKTYKVTESAFEPVFIMALNNIYEV